MQTREVRHRQAPGRVPGLGGVGVEMGALGLQRLRGEQRLSLFLGQHVAELGGLGVALRLGLREMVKQSRGLGGGEGSRVC